MLQIDLAKNVQRSIQLSLNDLYSLDHWYIEVEEYLGETLLNNYKQSNKLGEFSFTCLVRQAF